MSSESVEQVIGRALIDPGYRELLLDRPEEALSGHDLTDEEAAALKGLEREHLDAVVQEVEERISKSGLFLTEMKFNSRELFKVEGLVLSDLAEIALKKGTLR